MSARSGLAAHRSVQTLGSLAAGLALGLLFPRSPLVLGIAQSGTWFPKTIVTFAAAIIFILMSAALAKTLLTHRRSGRFLLFTIGLYVLMGLVSLLYVSAWIPLLTGLPMQRPGQELPGLAGWLNGIAVAFQTAFTEQPLLQVLVAAFLSGAAAGSMSALHPAARGLIRCGDWMLNAFSKLLWYYPVMIGCLAIFIPARFGTHGLAIYGRTTLNLAIVAVGWSAGMILLVRLVTTRSWAQIWKYFATVYTAGFGTGGSYETLPVNLVSAEHDLGLRPEVARVSIVLGTVLNKNVATMAVLLVTVSTCALLGVPISMVEIGVLIPPVMLLGLESPGIPGGAGVFMSPVVASLLAVPDAGLFVTTFVTLYSGLIPMIATAGNTTDDGFVGAIINDRLTDLEAPDTGPPLQSFASNPVPYPRPVRAGAAGLLALALWLIVAPQARNGLPALQWLARSAFRGEALLGAAALLVALTGLLGGRAPTPR
ncbi:MAG: cation:dicarboxylase symporter family transporter [Acidobacteriota bacterium]